MRFYSSNPIARSRDYSLTGTARINLRDSAIDLVSDDENSEAYTAVSLAGNTNLFPFKYDLLCKPTLVLNLTL